MGLYSKDIILSKLELTKVPQEGLDIDREWLKREVLQPLYHLTEDDIKALCKIAGDK